MSGKTYHHLIYGIHDVQHLISGDVAIIVKVIEFESPCIEKDVKVHYGSGAHTVIKKLL